MILEFHLSADRDNIHVLVPALAIDEATPAIVGINTRDRQIVAVGETAEQIQAKAPEYWERHGRDVAFIHPFDLITIEPAVGEHKDLVAARLVAWYAGRASQQWKRAGFVRQVIGPWLDSIDYHLELPAFAQLGQDRRQKLVGWLKRVLPSVHGIYINDRRVAGR